MSAEQIIHGGGVALAKRTNKSPFMTRNQAILTSAVATTVVYTADHPGTESDNYARLRPDGTETEFAVADYPALANLPAQSQTTAADALKVIVLVNDFPVPTTDYVVSAGADITFDTAPSAGSKVEVLIPTDVTDIIKTLATEGVNKTIVLGDFFNGLVTASLLPLK